MRKVLSRATKVRAITAHAKRFEASLERAEGITSKIFKAFENPKTSFTPVQIKSIVASLDKLAEVTVKGLTGSFTSLKTAVRTQIPSDRIVAHIEHGHDLLGKIAILKSQALAAIAADDVTIDESGYLVDDQDQGPAAEGGDAEAPKGTPDAEDAEGKDDDEGSLSEKIEDLKEDLESIVEELEEKFGGEDSEKEEEPKEEEEPKTAAKKATPKKAEENPDQPKDAKDNPKGKEFDKAQDLADDYEKAPPMVKKSTKKAEENPDQPKDAKDNPPSDEETLADLAEEYEADPSDPENLEMEDSAIDDAVNIEILSDSDVSAMQEEITSSKASLKNRKLASASKTAAQTEDSLLTNLVSSMFD